MDIVTIDFETYYDRDYSLSKMTTEEYLRDERFEIIGVGVKKNDERTLWYSDTETGIRNWLYQFDLSNSFVLAHHAMFDAAILTWRLGIRPKVIGDTLSMARGIYGPSQRVSLAKLSELCGVGNKGDEVVRAMGKRREDFYPSELAAYGEYCKNDVDLCYGLFQYFIGSMDFPKSELRVIDATIRMFSDPILVLNKPLLEAHLEAVRLNKEELLRKICADRESLMSNPKFAELLKGLGVDPPTKNSLRTGKTTWAFSRSDSAFMKLQEHQDTRVQALIAARLGVKSTLEETRTERFIAIAGRGTLPIPISYAAAISHRWGGADKINMQNLPARGAGKNTLKQAICAPEGYVLIDCDSSQIEARTLAWLSGQEDLLADFRAQDTFIGPKSERPDVYKNMAAKIYGKHPAKINDPERFMGKTVVLGAGYGCGALKFQAMVKNAGVDITLEESIKIINTYRTYNAHIVRFWNLCADIIADKLFARKSGIIGKTGVVWADASPPLVAGITLPNEMRILYHNLRKGVTDSEFIYDGRHGPTKLYGPKLTENITQAVARCIIAEQLIKISKRYRVVLTVHDSIVILAPIAEAEVARAFVEQVMRTPPTWATGLPLNCESGVGKTYGDC